MSDELKETFESAVPAHLPESHFAALADEIFRERVLRARRTPPEEKLLAGEELFDYACSITLCGIRDQFPEASEERCLQILRDRLALRERMESLEART